MSELWRPLALAAALIVLITAELRRDRGKGEMWRGAIVALSAFLLAALLERSLAPSEASRSASLFLHLIGWSAMLLALEGEAFDRISRDLEALTWRLHIATVVIFVVGLAVYLVLLPCFVDGSTREMTFWAGRLDFVLLAWSTAFCLFHGCTAGDARTRAVGMWAFAALMGLMVVWALWPPWLWAAAGAAVIFLWAARQADRVRGRASEPTLEEPPDPGASTLLLALILPPAHFAAHQIAWLDTGHRPGREAWLALWVLLLGCLALAQSWLLRRRVEKTLNERRRIESALDHSLRLHQVAIERRGHQEELARSREKFVKTFDKSPYGLLISRYADGRHLEVNSHYLTLIGYSRDEVVGKTSVELGIWLDSDDRRKFIHALREEGRLTEFLITFRRKSGETRQALVSTERLDFAEDTLLLTVARDREHEDQAQANRDRAETWLESSDLALILFDQEQTILRKNRAAALLLAQPGFAELLWDPALKLEVDLEGQAERSLSPDAAGRELAEIDATWLRVDGSEKAQYLWIGKLTPLLQMRSDLAEADP